jgi:hypothetical protein
MAEISDETLLEQVGQGTKEAFRMVIIRRRCFRMENSMRWFFSAMRRTDTIARRDLTGQEWWAAYRRTCIDSSGNGLRSTIH